MKDEHAASKKPESERPPRGLPLWKLLVLLVLVAAGVGIGIWVAPWMRPATKAQVTEAVDQVNRALSQKLIGQATHDDVVKALNRLAPKPKTKGTQWYQAPMMPWIISQHPGKSPMGMDMVPIDPAKFTGEIAINPVIVQDIGVRIAPVTQGPLVKTIRTVGTVDYDEPLVRDVNLKVGGWIEKLYVNYLGQHVKRGEPLFSLYSPDLYAAQEEYLLAWKNRRKVGAPFVPEAAANARDLVKAARTKLEYYDITDAQIAALQKSGRVAKTMTMRSPYDGVVTAKHANEGMHVKPGMQVFRIADLSKVWVMVTLYEYQLPYVEVGQEAVMTLPYVPGQTFKGKVIYIYPYLNDKTRQVQVRLQFDNPTGLLKPGMYANIELHSELAAKRTLVPRSAVIDTGTRQMAFVSLGGGKFEPRNVKLGVESDSTSGSDLVEVLSGLKPGEMVVVNGQFLLDSEANTREALAKMMKGHLAANQKAVAKVTGTSELSTLPPALATQLNRLLTAYLHIQGALYNDKLTGIAVEGKAIASAADAMTDIAIAGQPHFWHEHQEIATIGGKGTELTKATDLKTARADFADLSTALGTLLKATGVPPNFGKPLQELHCPMYRANQGGNIWMQTGAAVHNPFMGIHSPMPGCYDQRHVLPTTGGKAGVPAAGKAKPAAKATAEQQARLTADQQTQVDQVLKGYLTVQQALADGKLPPVAGALAQVHDNARQLAKAKDQALAGAAAAVLKAADISTKDLTAVRVGFAKLSPTVAALLELAPADATVAPSVYELYCPMKKATWLQVGHEVHNPYLGQGMSTCGTVRTQIMLHTTKKD